MAEINDEYRERMNDVLTLYEQPYDALLPVICLDEKNVELHDERRKPIRNRLGLLRDFEYVRRGTANIFMLTEPKGGRHYARVTSRRTRGDFAACLKWIADKYSQAVTIHLVMDNLNTHTEKSLVLAYGKTEGRRLWGRFTVHYTPKHASWLNQAEIAIGAMERCCLARRRFPTKQSLRQAVTPFWAKRRKEHWLIDWRFTTQKAKSWLNTFVSQH